MKTKNTLYKLTKNFLNIYKIRKKKILSINSLHGCSSRIINTKYNIKICIKGLLNFFFNIVKKKNTMLILFHQNVKINRLLMLLKKPLYIFFSTKRINHVRYSFLLNFLTRIYNGNFILLFRYHLSVFEKFSKIKLLLLNNLLYANIQEIEIFNFFQQKPKHINNFFFTKKSLRTYLLNNFKCSFLFFLKFQNFLIKNIILDFQKVDLMQFVNISFLFYLKSTLKLNFSEFKNNKAKKKLILEENLITIFQEKILLIRKIIDFRTSVLYFFKIYKNNFFSNLNTLFDLKNNLFCLNLYLTNDFNIFFYYF